MSIPIRLNPIFKERIWGKNSLSSFNYNLYSDKVGEAWLLCDHDEGSNIPVLDRWFLGVKGISYKTKRIKTLIKLLDANEDLSIQVHPSDLYVGLKESELGKAELWYVLNAEPDGAIIYGFNKDTTKEELELAIYNNKLLNRLNKIRVEKGDIIYIPPGTVHALCKGVVVIEIQQNSDTTFRLFDYDRIGLGGAKRELHIKESLEVINYNEKKPQIKKSNCIPDGSWYLIHKNEFFTVEECKLSKLLHCSTDSESFSFIFCLEGNGLFIWNERVRYDFKKGDSFLLPAGNYTYSFISDKESHLLRSYIE